MIPFIDLPAQHKALEEELLEVFRDALKSAAFIGGHQVEEFEKEFAAFCGTKYCVGVNSGTDALRFALIAAGIGPGDEVITVPNTFIATAEAISQVGATPLFVDIDEQTYNMDPNKLEDYLKVCNLQSAVCNRPKAIIPVDLYGQPANMDSILEIAERHNLMVISDACQSHGAEYLSQKANRWLKAGSMAFAAAFSFYPGKNLGACGEGGAVTTNDKTIAEKIKMIRDHGQAQKYYHDIEGYNGRLDAMQAGFLRIKLKHLSEWNEGRRQNAHRYNEFLNNQDGVITPHEPSWAKAVYHLYVIRHQKRDGLQKYLSEKGIATGIHYPIPIHLQNAYSHLGYREGRFPVSEKVSKEILSLPMYPELTADQQEYIVEKISEFLSK
jgi:dTDP-4-amino-4,6-dideoxygalactose transaminase